jgi:hypothetical protein
VKFEYDEKKSQINKAKHNIDFVEAQKLWQDEDTYRIISVRRCRKNEEKNYENYNS